LLIRSKLNLLYLKYRIKRENCLESAIRFTCAFIERDGAKFVKFPALKIFAQYAIKITYFLVIALKSDCQL